MNLLAKDVFVDLSKGSQDETSQNLEWAQNAMTGVLDRDRKREIWDRDT